MNDKKSAGDKAFADSPARGEAGKSPEILERERKYLDEQIAHLPHAACDRGSSTKTPPSCSAKGEHFQGIGAHITEEVLPWIWFLAGSRGGQTRSANDLACCYVERSFMQGAD